jgi:hypothetical protein
VREQVSHPYKITGRITVLYILTFTFLDSRRDELECYMVQIKERKIGGVITERRFLDRIRLNHTKTEINVRTLQATKWHGSYRMQLKRRHFRLRLRFVGTATPYKQTDRRSASGNVIQNLLPQHQ